MIDSFTILPCQEVISSKPDGSNRYGGGQDRKGNKYLMTTDHLDLVLFLQVILLLLHERDQFR